MEKKILHLTLHRKWFDEIATGKKVFEYRAMTPYWNKRLLDPCLARVFDEIHFRNGYHPAAPWMRVKWGGLGFTVLDGVSTFAIGLAGVLEIRNWSGPKIINCKIKMSA